MASVQDVVGGIASDDGLNRACLLPYKYRSHLDHDLYRCRRHRTSLLQPWSVPLFTLETHPTKSFVSGVAKSPSIAQGMRVLIGRWFVAYPCKAV